MDALPWHTTEFDRLIAGKARLPHAILLHGRIGIGKVIFGRALARTLLCEKAAGSSAACGRCTACHWFDGGNHPDFRLLEPASLAEDRVAGEEGTAKKGSAQIVIEQVRDLADFVNVSSHRGGAKVILVHPAEALNANAANALLKNLEEPPPGTHFLLVAHRVRYLLPTIRSRCRQIALSGPASNEAVGWLTAQGVREPALALAQTGNSPLLARALTEREYWDQRASFLAHITAPAFEPLVVAESIRDFAVKDIVGWLQKWTFDLIYQAVLGKVRYNPDFSAPIGALAARIEKLAVLRFHRELIRLQRVIDHPLNTRLFLEQLLLDYARLLGSSPGPAAKSA